MVMSVQAVTRTGFSLAISPAQCVSHFVSLLAAGASVHPHQTRPSLTPAANLDEEQLTQFARPSYLVMVP